MDRGEGDGVNGRPIDELEDAAGERPKEGHALRHGVKQARHPRVELVRPSQATNWKWQANHTVSMATRRGDTAKEAEMNLVASTEFVRAEERTDPERKDESPGAYGCHDGVEK